MKYLLHFEKGDTARWLSHLDVLRTFERAIRRSDMPVAFSAGFNPRVRLAFTSALPCGATGALEPATLELTEALTADEVQSRLNLALPPGIRIRSAITIADQGSRDLLNSYDSADYRVTCDCKPDVTRQDADQAVLALLGADTLVRDCIRKGRPKPIDLRPHIRSVEVTAVDEGRMTLRVVLAVMQDGSVRPIEVVAALSEMLPGLTARHIHRNHMSISDPSMNAIACSLDRSDPPYPV